MVVSKTVKKCVNYDSLGQVKGDSGPRGVKRSVHAVERSRRSIDDDDS